jgi:hypothetical protein
MPQQDRKPLDGKFNFALSEFIEKLNTSKEMSQQDSPIPMADDQDENKQPQSNAIELHDTGLENVFKAILKQQARQAKKKLKKLEAQLPKLENEQKDE